MKVKDLIDLVDDIKPNAFQLGTKLAWLNEVEGFLCANVFLMTQDEIDVNGVDENSYTDNSSLLVKAPYDALYRLYLIAQIDYANEDFDLYQNDMALYNSMYDDFNIFFANTYNPAISETYHGGEE